ncbi:hypothetical protein NFC81_11975 [Salinispirillum sp. LH 10-3-1]|uniref:Uncharacterized protein n=1 Tax=Salinispirillum sp. LH 10-3-1 TaxID=2952525 RepID=A0AB38YDH1_9GAMM
MTTTYLSAHALTFGFTGHTPLFHNLNVHLHAQPTALIGGSGAGTSVLASAGWCRVLTVVGRVSYCVLAEAITPTHRLELSLKVGKNGRDTTGQRHNE